MTKVKELENDYEIWLGIGEDGLTFSIELYKKTLQPVLQWPPKTEPNKQLRFFLVKKKELALDSCYSVPLDGDLNGVVEFIKDQTFGWIEHLTSIAAQDHVRRGKASEIFKEIVATCSK